MPRYSRPRDDGPTDSLEADVGARIHQARTERGMTLAELGGEDLSRSFLSLVENGKARISIRSLAIIAKRLDCPLSSFFPDDVTAKRQLAELAVSLAELAMRDSHPEDALRLLRDAEQVDEFEAHVLWIRGWAQLLGSQFADAAATLRQALALHDPADVHLSIEIHYRLGRALYHMRHFREAEQILEAGGSLAIRSDDENMAGRFRVMLGHICAIQNNFDAALVQYRSAHPLLDSVRNLDTLAAVYSGLSTVYRETGDIPQAIYNARKAQSIYELRDRQHAATVELNNLAVIYERAGDLLQARAVAQRAIERAHHANLHDVEAMAHGSLASILFGLGRYDEALAEANTAEGMAGSDLSRTSAWAWVVQARVAERRGETERADDLFQRALAVFDESEEHADYTNAAFAYGRILMARGQGDAAAHWMSTAQEKMRTTDIRVIG